MKIYCNAYSSNAGKWIYDGYRAAWKSLGYEVCDILEVNNAIGEYYIMTTDFELQNIKPEKIKNSIKTFLFVQPNTYPLPWGRHPNFISQANRDNIELMNQLDNVHYWTFSDVKQEYYSLWEKKIYTLPLAYDSLSYRQRGISQEYIYDVCFVGGWADNGFNEKKDIIINTFKSFKDSGLKCAFFINKGITHEQENNILLSSKVALNIHDAYQRALGLDTNERTFKSLGSNGCLVSDTVLQMCSLFPDVENSLDSDKLVDMVKKYVELEKDVLTDIKNKNKELISSKHTYQHRVRTLLDIK